MDSSKKTIMSDQEFILLRGVRVHNLQNIDVTIPLGKLTVVTGVSGAGKSSLVFDTLYAESQRRYLQSFSPYVRQFLERFDQPEAEWIGPLPPAVLVGFRSPAKNPRATVGTLTEILDYLGLLFTRRGVVTCYQCGQEVKAQNPADVLEAAQNLPPGTRFTVAFPSRPEKDEPPSNWAAALREEGFVRVQIEANLLRLGEQELPSINPQDRIWVLVDRMETGKITVERLTDSVETAFARGHGRAGLLTDRGEIVFDRRFICPRCNILYPEPQPRLFYFQDPLGACPTCHGTGLENKSQRPCPTCHGTRFNEQALSVRVRGQSIADLTGKDAEQLKRFFQEWQEPAESDIQLLIAEIRRRLGYLQTLKLDYLTLDRGAGSLSLGEFKRLRLGTALGSTLVQALYLLDEPTTGLHPRDIAGLVKELNALRDAGNTVVVIEHDRELIEAANHVIDLGPGAGEEGGRLAYQGPPGGLLHCEESLTGSFLQQELEETNSKRRSPQGHLRLKIAGIHNLQNLTVDFPLGVLCVVTGVSGAGKSSLVEDALYPALSPRKNTKGKPTQNENLRDAPLHADVDGANQIEEVHLVDQEPLTRTARSNPATYLKIFDEIREVFAETSEARIRNFGPGTFSFNQPGGRCEVCEGQGTLTVDMQFLADVAATCSECHGARYRKEILAVKVRSLSIAEVLNLTVREAFRFFRAHRNIEKKLKWLLDVGLDYLRLGQPFETLSGGEGQRLKLAGHLASSRKARSLFILLEPTNGLHPADVEQLLACFQRLLETGHSLIVVENDLQVIRSADHIIDLGPGSGTSGGRVVGQGTPEEVAQVPESATGQFLRPFFSR